jgi:hypothetical protein
MPPSVPRVKMASLLSVPAATAIWVLVSTPPWLCAEEIAAVNLDLDRPARALDHYHHALTLAATAGLRLNEARILEAIGDTHLRVGNQAAASHAWNRALAAYTAIDSPHADLLRARIADLRPDPPTSQATSRATCTEAT